MWLAASSLQLILLRYFASGFIHSVTKVPPPEFLLRSTRDKEEITNEDAKNKNKDGDIPAWLKPLLRREQKTSNDIEIEYNESDERLFDSFPFSIGRQKKSKLWEEEMSPIVASLSGMINVEALMAAANVTAANITTDMEGDESMESFLQSLSPSLNTENQVDAAMSQTDAFADALSFLDGSMRWEKFMSQMAKKNSSSTVSEANNTMGTDRLETTDLAMDELKNDMAKAGKSPDVDKILGEATKRLEFAVNSVSSTFSPSAIQDLVVKASKTLALKEASGNLTLAAKIVFDEARKAPRATAKYTAELIEFANITLAGGMKPLFKNYGTVKAVPTLEWRQVIKKGAEYGAVSSAIYENTVPNTHNLGHSIVAQGKSFDIAWMITDSIQQSGEFYGNAKDEPIMVRSFIFRGFDASDEEVDREDLLNTICAANPVSLENTTIQVHEGMFRLAESLYEELESYIDLTAPSHKLVFAGHSIGGSLSILMMAILSQRKSSAFVRDRLLRVFTYGSPPTFSTVEERPPTSLETCWILETLDLPQDIVHGYSQPWDPVPRLFTPYDPLYPLIDDLGEDGVTPWQSGPTRTLRPVVKAILEAWEGWPRLREVARNKMGQNYQSVGKQYLLLPDPTRYLTDRLVSVNIPVPSINSILQISSQELLPALNEVFLLDTFGISTVPVAIRSFVHHFFPAYLDVFAEYAMKSDPDRKALVEEETGDKRRKGEV